MSPLVASRNARTASQIDEYRAGAADVRADWDEADARITADTTISAAAKQQARTTARDEAQTRLDELRTAEMNAVYRGREALEEWLFGIRNALPPTPDEILVYRDAHDRAAKLTDSDAACALLAIAARSRDDTLAAAILHRARAAGWAAAITAYTAHNPSRSAHLDALTELDDYDDEDAAAAYTLPPP